MTISAKNYAAQAQRGLTEFAKSMSHNPDLAEDKRNILDLVEDIGNAVHFALPDDGNLFDDMLKGLRGVAVRLPYPEITIEYHVPKREYEDGSGLVHSPKRLVYAKEVDLTSKTLVGRYSVEGVDVPDRAIIVVAASEISGTWMPMLAGCIVPTTWDQYEKAVVMESLVESPKNAPSIVMDPFLFCPNMLKVSGHSFNDPEIKKSLFHDIGTEVSAVLELCEALTCSNVKTDILERVDQSKNARRIKSGKLPLYETKILTVELPKGIAGEGGGNGLNGDRNGPRQHLRRGHIRNLSDGRKVWVSSCVVGSSIAGRIEKSYNATTGVTQ